MHLLGGLLQHVVTVPAGDGDESDGLGVVTDLLDEGGRLLDNFVETVLAPLYTNWANRSESFPIRKDHGSGSGTRAVTDLGGVHFVHGNDELTHTEGEGKEGVLASLAILGDTGLELTGTTGDDEDGTVSLGGTGDHVLDEVTVSGGVDDLFRAQRRIRREKK